MSNYFITNYIVLYDLYETQDLISEDFSIPRVIIYLL